MTEEPEQPQETPDDGEKEYNALMQRTGELVEQFFQLRNYMAGGQGVHVRSGIRTFIDAET